MRPIAYLAAALALLGCQPLPPAEQVTLTPDVPPGQFAPDPTDQAIIAAQDVFWNGKGLSGDPARTARATAFIEYLATDFTTLRWLGSPALVAPQLQLARRDLRAFLGIAADAPAQPIITAMLHASDALASGDRAGAEKMLSAAPFRDPPGTILARLNAMPRLPNVASGAQMAWVARFLPDDNDNCIFNC